MIKTGLEKYKRINARLLISAFALVLIFSIINTHFRVHGADYVFSEAEDKIYNTLRAAGYSKAGACGILGNISVENSLFKPDLYGNNKTTYGLFQWNNVGDRMDNLFKWCKNRGLKSNQIEGQIAFAIHELEGGDPIAKRLNGFLKSATDPKEAAMEFAVGFERCVGSSLRPEEDTIYMGTIYPEYYSRTYQALKKRIERGGVYFEGYDAYDPDPTFVFNLETKATPGIVFELEDKWQEDLEKALNVDYEKLTDVGEILKTRGVCILIGYLCGCLYLFLLFIDRNKFNNHGLKELEEIPHARTIMGRMGIKKGSYVLINDIFKLLLAIGITVPLVKGINLDEKILYTGLGVIVGNACPFWNKFKGGVGFTVTILTIILYMPIWGFWCCIIGLLFAALLKSLTVGVAIMSLLMIPTVYYFKDSSTAIAISFILITLVISHQRVLLRYFDRKVLHNHFRNKKRVRRVA